jgi:uncharacterized protein YkwD
MTHAIALYRAALLCAAIFLCALVAAGATNSHAAGRCDVADVTVDAEEARFVELLNAYRAANGVGPLVVAPSLTRAATWMAIDLGANDRFAHEDSLRRDTYTRIADCGYGGPAGENLAAGKTWDTAERALAAWKASEAHNRNMLLQRYVVIGVARAHAPGSRYGWYWVTTFGTAPEARDQAAAATSTGTSPSVSSATVITLRSGGNLITWPATSTSLAAVAAVDGVRAVYAWDQTSRRWLRFIPGGPAYANTLDRLRPGQIVWVVAGVPAKLWLSP